jgi:GTP-binding protein EngB required for normal cell division
VGPVRFNEAQQRRLLASARHADKLLGEIEQILRAADSKSPFPKYRPDVAPHQALLLASHIARFRNHLSRVLTAAGIEHDRPPFSALHAIRVTLAFVRIAVEEMAPEHLRGYGELPETAAEYLRGLSAELEGLLTAIDRTLALGERADLAARIQRLDPALPEKELLGLLDRIITSHELAEFRMPLAHLVEKAESREFEIAVFGRVSSGKSSLLNHILGFEVLPVGVNPITAVPVRLRYGPEAAIEVSLAGGERVRGRIGDLEQYVSEERNAGNQLGVTRVIVELPSPRLAEGLVFVDTPGLGSLATAGAAETLAYLPRSDLGIVLVSAASPISEEDLGAIGALVEAGITPLAVLSKADLLRAEEIDKAVSYTTRQIEQRLGRRVDVCPVSTRPGHEGLLEDWFRRYLAPLEGRHRELVRESIRRKLLALGGSVEGALRAALGTGPAFDRAQLEEVEARLRAAAGRIEEARRALLEASDRVRLLREQAIQRAAAAVVAGQRPLLLAEIAGELAAGAAADAVHRLRELARDLEASLQLAASTLGGNQTPAETAMEDLIREMPRWEAALEAVELGPPWFGFAPRAARAWVARRLRRIAGERLEAAFASYGRALERWGRRTLAELQNRFEQEADGYRAQIDRLRRRQERPPEERRKIQQALRDLEAALAATTR